jgi:DNA-binding NarL/FixJ family response regulator
MFPRNSLSQRFNIAIRKNWCKECVDIFDQLLPDDSFSSQGLNNNNLNVQNMNIASINRMKEKIETLESLSDQLYQYLCFLVEHLPELILKTIHTEFEINHTGEYLSYSAIKVHQEGRCPADDVHPFPTRREKDVLELLAKGYCAKEIAKKLFISETTVITHKKNLKKKFNAKNTVELISKVRKVY